MVESPQTSSEEDIPIPAFTPVPLLRGRHDGWTEVRQQRFVQALVAMGSVGKAAKAVGKSRAAAYALRQRAGAESFSHAWDQALDIGQSRMFDYAIDRAMNGVTTVRVLRGGSIKVSAGPDMQLVTAALREPPARAAVQS